MKVSQAVNFWLEYHKANFKKIRVKLLIDWKAGRDLSCKT